MSPTPPPSPGTIGAWAQLGDVRAFGKYVLVRKLAEGGMAEIFLAKLMGPEGFERDVVVKRMLKQLSDSSEFVTMFLDEARIAARLVHPNIVAITDLGQAEGQYFLAMEYLAGEDLSHVINAWYLRQEPIPAEVACRIMLGACLGLDFAHRYSENGRPLNIVHRDVTPSNILVTYQGSVKLVDFGIAKAETKVAKTGIGTVKGKWVYMSPEQARGHPLDRRSDVFSLGLTFYELLTAERVFQRENELAILKALLTSAIANPKKFRPELPDAVVTILGRALTRDAAARYQSAAEMAHDLETFLAATPAGLGTAALGQYMVGLFGRERMELKTQIPTLRALAQMGVKVPALESFPKTVSSGAPLRPAEGSEPRAAAHVPTSPGADSAPRPAAAPGRSHRSLAIAAAGGALATVVAAAGLYFALRSPPASPAAAEGGPAPLQAADASVAAVSVAASPAVEAGAPATDARKAVEPDAGLAASAGAAGAPDAGVRLAARPAPSPSPQPLTGEMVAAQVAKSRARLLSCFERHRAALAEQEGKVTIVFTILQSGQVSDAKVSTPGFEASPLSGCIIEQIKAIRFPRHTEEEVTLQLPFVYTVKAEGG